MRLDKPYPAAKSPDGHGMKFGDIIKENYGKEQ